MKHLALLAVLALIGGCELLGISTSSSDILDPSGRLNTPVPDDSLSIRFRTDRPSYASGQKVVLRLENESSEQLGYNLCSPFLEQQVHGKWKPAVFQQDRVCQAILLLLGSGEATAAVYKLNPKLTAGTYRLRIDVEYGEDYERVGIVTNVFSITK